MAYKNGDAVFAEDINKAIDDSTTAVNTANTAKTASDKASADVIDLAKQIGTKQGTTVTVGGVVQNAVAFNGDPQTEIDRKLDKLECQYSTEVKFGETGVLFIGSFPVYDTNITIDISSTTDITHNARLIIACQNHTILSAAVYGDIQDNITSRIFIRPSSPSYDLVKIYYAPQSWSKNILDIRGSGVGGVPTHICEILPNLPTDATLHPVNYLNIKANKNIVVYDKNSADPNINWGYPSGIHGGVEITNKDFTPYKYLMAYATHNAGDINFVTTINTINANKNYTASSSSITNGASLHFQAYKMTNSSIIANRVGYYDNVAANNFTNWQDKSITGEYHTIYYIYKIEGVLK